MHCCIIIMKEWFRATLLLCVFGFLKEIRPSDPYIFEYLTGSWKNVTSEQIVNEIYPYSIYSNILVLFLVILLTDGFYYKPVITLLGLSGITAWSLLIWRRNLIGFQFSQTWYGIFLATEVAYYAYIYAKVEKKYYIRVTAYTRAAVLAGSAFSATFAGIAVSKSLVSLLGLNYITLGAMVLATGCSLYLPSVQKSICFDHIWKSDRNVFCKLGLVLKQLFTKHFVKSFSNIYIIKGSIWWILITSGCLLSESFINLLWEEITEETNENSFSGVVYAISFFSGFLSSLTAAFLTVEWEVKGDQILSVCTVLEGAVTLISSQTTNIHTSYVCYVVYCGLYNFIITIASSEIAKNIEDNSFGLVFGFITVISVIIEFIFALIVVNSNIGLGMKVRNQFLVYGYYHLIMFLLVGFILLIIKYWKCKNQT